MLPLLDKNILKKKKKKPVQNSDVSDTVVVSFFLRAKQVTLLCTVTWSA